MFGAGRATRFQFGCNISSRDLATDCSDIGFILWEAGRYIRHITCLHPWIHPSDQSNVPVASVCAVRVRAPFVSSIDVGFMVVPLQCERDERRGREDERDSHSAIAKCRGEERSASHSGLRSRPLAPSSPFLSPARARQPPMILPHSLPHTRFTGCRHTKMTFKHDLLRGVHDICMPQELLCIVS